MKSKYILPASSRHGAFALLLATSSLIAPSMAQTVIDWSSTAGTSDWATGTNWVGGAAPANNLTGSIAQFNQSAYTSQPNYGTTSVAGIIVGNGSTAVGALTLSGTQLNIGASGIDIKAQSGTVTLNNAVRLGASQTWTNNSGSLFTVGATITNASTTPFALTIAGTGNTTITGVISNGDTTGTTSLVKNGSGTLRFSAASSYTGGITINSGKVELNVNANSNMGLGNGNVTIGRTDNTIIDYIVAAGRSITGVTSWTLQGTGTITRANSGGGGLGWGTAKISGSSGGLIYTSSNANAAIQVGATTSDYTGGTTLQSGTIVLNGGNNADTLNAGSFGNASVSSNVVTFAGASIRGGQTSATRTIFNNISFAADTTLAATSGGADGILTWAGEVTLNGSGARTLTQSSATQDWVFSNTIKNGNSSDLTININAVKSVALNAANTFSGTLLATGTGGGALALGNVNAVQNATLDTGSATASRAVTFTAAGTNTYNIGALQGSDDLDIGANTLSVGAKAADTTFAGAISGTGGLTKVGSNKLTLSTANTYSGVTTISGGTLALQGSARVASSSRIHIAGSSTLDLTGITGSFTLGNTQTLTGNGTVLNTGKTFVANGTMGPGNSPGTLTYDGGVVQLGGNAILNWQIADATGSAGSGYDTVSLINNAVLDLSLLSSANPYNINLVTLSGVNPDVSGNALNFNSSLNYEWVLFSTTQSINGFSQDKFAINSAGFSNSLNGGNFSLALADSNTDLVLRFTAIPETSVSLLGGLSALTLLRRRRK